MSHRIKLLLGLFLAALLLFFFLRSTDWGEVVSSMRAANPWLLALVFLAQFPLFLLRAVRWQCFLAPIKRIPIPPLLSSMMIGYMISFIFPGRLGEIVRPVLLGMRERISKTSAFATIVLERLFDTLAVLVLLQTYVLLAPWFGLAETRSTALMRSVTSAGLVGLAVVLAALAVIVLFRLNHDLTMRLLRKLVRILPKGQRDRVLRFLESFLVGLNVYHNTRTFVLIFLYSLGVWGGICTTIWIGVRAFGIDVPYLLIFPIQTILMIGVAIPTPGMVGGFHASMKIGLVQMAGVDPNLAVSTVLVLHVLLVSPAILQGLYHAWREGFSLGEIRTIGEREEALGRE